jgi:AcrR family transcriptional regulator
MPSRQFGPISDRFPITDSSSRRERDCSAAYPGPGTTGARHLAADPRRRRRAEKHAAILAEAWRLAHRDGLAAISLRDLAAAVGLRQPSLYVYFASKMELYDAMFADGYAQLLAWMDGRSYDGEPRAALVRFVTDFVRFNSDDLVRHQLLFQRTIPGFEPSEASFALALEFYERNRLMLALVGASSQADLDVFTALVAGMAHQQTANDPGGDRWVKHAQRVVEMYLDDVARRGRRQRRRA